MDPWPHSLVSGLTDHKAEMSHIYLFCVISERELQENRRMFSIGRLRLEGNSP